ncbi:hypothetical protein [Paracoccus sp. MC1862]|uniref:hypothetical protein n=2 Tax=Paracoccus sp. MC1862 TaxID=2760307 RepID=UPI0017A414BC|nr:hypothetical protein [Paracoccus sp. MC1862]MBB1498790.1 hypothetical protein [Paracoccus sp. MC1862]QQO43804.1 hypothetical protein JGR78_10220 [Paracoccus sp. MC1862]
MQSKERPGANDPVMPLAERALIAENLRLALDEIETGAGDFASVFNAVAFQREAIRTAHRRLDRLRETV